MPILGLGLSYKRAPVEVLERLAFDEDALPKAYHHLSRTAGIHGAVIVSTCNRVEVYAEVDAYHSGFQALKAFLAESREVPFEEFAEPLYSHYEEQATVHLLSVAAGIDSMVLGEPQILSQVRSALRAAESEGAAGSLVSALFRRAIRTGRRARAETAIAASPGTLVEAGARIAGRWLGGLAGRDVLIVGAGAMSELALATVGPEAGHVRVLNRTARAAERVAGRFGGRAGTLEDLVEALSEADLAVSSTAAAGIVVDRDALQAAVSGRDGRPLFILDLAVPRDVDPGAGSLPGVELVDIDDLQDEVGGADRAEVERVRAIVEEEAVRFQAWRRSLRLAPVIQALYDRAERIRLSELERAAPRLAGLSETEREAIEAATRAVVAKLLHGPVARLKDPEAGDELARTLAELFGLEPPAE